MQTYGSQVLMNSFLRLQLITRIRYGAKSNEKRKKCLPIVYKEKKNSRFRNYWEKTTLS